MEENKAEPLSLSATKTNALAGKEHNEDEVGHPVNKKQVKICSMTESDTTSVAAKKHKEDEEGATDDGEKSLGPTTQSGQH